MLVLCIMFATPLVFDAVYDNFCKKMKKNENMLFFVWSTLIVSALAACLVLANDIIMIVQNIPLYPSTSNSEGFHDIYEYFIVATCLMGVVLVYNLISLICLKKKHKDDDFPIPTLLKVISNLLRKCVTSNQGNYQRLPENDDDLGERRGTCVNLCCSDCIVLLLAVYGFMLFFQLMSFHSLYIVLGAITTPVQTISLTTFYIALFFSVVAFIAMFLKSTNDSDYYRNA